MADAPASTSAPGDQHSRPRPTFKIISRVVMAMRRFQASLNPTYEYGKRPSDVGEDTANAHHVVVPPTVPGRRMSGGGGGHTASGRTTSGRTLSGRPAAQHHGNKGGLLFRPLPDPAPAVQSG